MCWNDFKYGETVLGSNLRWVIYEDEDGDSQVEVAFLEAYYEDNPFGEAFAYVVNISIPHEWGFLELDTEEITLKHYADLKEPGM